MNDFGIVLHASNVGRVKSVTVLNEMYLRMAELAPIEDHTGQSAAQSQRTPDTPTFQQTLAGPDSSFTSPVADFSGKGYRSRTSTDVGHSTADVFGSSLAPTRSAGSYVHPSNAFSVTNEPSPHSHSSSGTTAISLDSTGAILSGSPNALRSDYPNPVSPSKVQREPPEAHYSRQPWKFQRPNSVGSDARSAYASSSGASIVSVTSPESLSYNYTAGTSNNNETRSISSQRQAAPTPSPMASADSSYNNSNSGTSVIPAGSPPPMGQMTDLFKTHRFGSSGQKIPFHSSPAPEYRGRLDNRPKKKRAVTEDTPSSSPRPPATSSKSSSRKFSLFGGRKSPAEEYFGFCKGAHLMQSGEDGMKLRNQSVSFTGQNNYWTCSNSMCCFEGLAVPKKDENKKTSFGFDEEIREAHGMKYRWSFLAKSHVMLGNSKTGYDFQCAFCMSQGTPPSRIKGDKNFIQHVATHQGQTPNDLRMPRLEYIVGRKASDWEKFDVNLPAPTAMLLETLEHPAELEASEQGLAEMEAPLASPARGSHSQPAIDRNGNHLARLGLGIRMSNDTVSRIVQDYGSEQRTSMRSHGAESSERLNETIAWRDVGTNQPHLNGVSKDVEGDYDGKEVTLHSPLDNRHPAIRDSVYSLHPAPLFASRTSSGSAENDSDRIAQPPQQLQQYQRERLDHHHHHSHEQPSIPLSEAYQRGEDHSLHIYTYENTADVLDPELRGSVPLTEPWQTSPATLPGRQVSMLVPEVVHSTPDPSHPGTKWMD